MGETVDQTLREIQSTRSALERDIDELFTRMPDGAIVAAQAKKVGGALAGAAVVIGLTAAKMRKRAELKERRQEARINAEELARAFSPHEPRADLVEDNGGGAGRLVLLTGVIAAAAAGLQYLRTRNGDLTDLTERLEPMRQQVAERLPATGTSGSRSAGPVGVQRGS